MAVWAGCLFPALFESIGTECCSGPAQMVDALLICLPEVFMQGYHFAELGVATVVHNVDALFTTQLRNTLASVNLA